MENAIKVQNLSVSINKFNILDNVNFILPKGAYMSIVGPNGSGKTTLLKTLMGLNKHYTGEIQIYNSENKIKYTPIAYVPQIKTLDRTFPAMAIELVLSGIEQSWSFNLKKSHKNIAVELLEKLSVSNIAEKQLSELSGGELQRVYLARCLIKRPSILLLDEPATGIDLVCEQNVNRIITEYNKEYGTTIVMITHDWSAAYHHTNYTLLLNKNQIYFGDSKNAFTEDNLQKTFSHLGHDHGIKFGLKM